MENTAVDTNTASSHGRDITFKTASSVSLVEAIGGVGALVLGIIGLMGVGPQILAACAAIVFGVALATQGGGVATRYQEMIAVDPDTREKAEVIGGTGAEILGGIAGFVLGLLALVGIAPLVLLASASIVFGASLLLGSASAMSLKNYLAQSMTGPHRGERMILESAASAEVLVGLAAITLGILALVGLAPMTLVLVSFLSLGAAAVIAGSAMGGSMLSAFYGG